ncbi:conserved hypothetical protein [Ruegeria lacuscaerulensis ITI-1157]|nr:conserved hypothetical protein [Ruegeria lacuscaerulensis ITI-1157]SHK05919.1 hypothetical protein SAMN05444404_3209 [Ruegeria lacuscaerulensis ITI-1157]
MSFFPPDFDPTADVVGVLELCEIDTPDGPARFIIGTDGVFTDVSGNQWWGSQLIGVGSLASALNGEAPAGSVTLSFFQDPDADDLIAQIRELGDDYVKNRPITLFKQHFGSMSEMYAPKTAPVPWLQRTMKTISYQFSGAQDRSIVVGFEAVTENRRAARRIILNTVGHSQLLGYENPSLEYAPTTDYEEGKLFG